MRTLRVGMLESKGYGGQGLEEGQDMLSRHVEPGQDGGRRLEEGLSEN